MQIHELNPPAPPEPWRQKLKEFWRRASDLQRTDMRVTLAMGDGTGAQRILESWHRELEERRRKKKSRGNKSQKKRRFQYGAYGGWFYPGYSFGTGTDAGSDMADGGGGESIQEQTESDTDIIDRFADSCARYLGLKHAPQIKLRRDPEWTRRHGTFGRYTAEPHNRIELATAGRHIIDILRTLAHEMTHAAQNEQIGLPADAGETGSEFEDGANAMAGRIMRHWADQEPEMFQGVDLEEGLRSTAAGLAAAACVAGTPGCATTGPTPTVGDALRTIQTVGSIARNPPTRDSIKAELEQELRNELRRQRGQPEVPSRIFREASGYIPTEAEKSDPRFSMALTQDIRPGETGRQANKLGLKTDSQGRPGLLMSRLENLLEGIKLNGIKSVEDFAVITFESFDAYRRWQQSPKSSQRGSTRYHAGKYSGIFASSHLAESTGDFEKNRALAERFGNDFRSLDQRSRVKIAVGQDVAILSSITVPSDSGGRVELSGFVTPKRIAKINLDFQDRIDTIQFDDGSVFPEAAEFTNVGGINLTNTVFFPNEDSARKANTKIRMWASRLESQGWTVERYVSESQTSVVKESAPVQPTAAVQQRRPAPVWPPQKKDRQPTGDQFRAELARVTQTQEQELTEVKMSPSALRQFLASPEAAGIRAGFEAEMIFRDTQGRDDQDSGPDYDADERVRGIDQVIEFFEGGDNGMSPRQAQRLREDMQEQYLDWIRESFLEDYFTESRFLDWAEEIIWPEVEDDYRAQARDALGDDEISDEELEKQALELFRDDAERDYARRGEWYDQADDEIYEYYTSDADEADWLSSQGYRWMTDIADAWDLEWPYQHSPEGTREWAEIGADLSRATGMPVDVGTGYHSVRRRPGRYVIESDSSIDPEDTGEAGLEIVSPPLPLPEALEQLRRVINWANGAGNAYTNTSTGLHMGVSLPYKGGEVDPVKLILFMGDRNILETFGRESNTYARSAMQRLQSKISDMRDAGPKQISGIMDLMKKNLIELAERDLKRKLLGDKYISVHPQDGYIEFRGPGGDYLAKSDEIDDVLENTMLRLAYAMNIAGRPDLYRNEYAKKLYKVLTGYKGAVTTKSGQDTRYRTEIESETENPFMQLFADYSAGTLSGPELKTRWADAVLQDERKSYQQQKPGFRDYAIQDRETGETLERFQASGDQDAVNYARSNYPNVDYEIKFIPSDKDVPPIQQRRRDLAKRLMRDQPKDSPKDSPKKSSDTMPWTWMTTGRARDNTTSNPSANWGIVRVNTDDIVHSFTRDTEEQAREYFDDWAKERISGPRSYQLIPLNPVRDPNALSPGESDWLVRWSEYRTEPGSANDGTTQTRERLVNDSLRTVARTAAEASERLINALAAQGRVAFNVTAEPTDRPPWRRSRELQGGAPGARIVNDPRPAQLEFTGRWLVRSTRTGETVHRISGIGNSQADANHHAARWVRSTGFDHGIEVVPEMGYPR